MKRRTFLKTIFPTIFAPKIIVPVWKVIKPVPRYESFGKFILPCVNRVFPTITAHELVSVQPMSMPSGTVFYMDFVTTSKSDNNCLDVKTPTIHPNNNSIIDDTEWFNIRE